MSPAALRALFAAVMALTAAPAARACECVSLDLAARRDAADYVLLAKVRSATPLESVRLTPVEVFKGRAPRSLVILTGRSDCDFFLPPVDPKPGQTYLVFASRAKVERQAGDTAAYAYASRCLSPAPDAAAADLRALRRRGR